MSDSNSAISTASSLEADVFVQLQRVADRLLGELADVLKPAALSPTQYNVLRVLRGAAGEGRSCREIGQRLITREPDITRLLDRLGARGLISRSRHATDRRVGKTCITPAGLKLLKTLDARVLELHDLQLAHLGRNRLRELLALLGMVLQESGE